ncbi:uncharacterized protein LOC115311463 [Ixodes scapularis]|uniref:uncharacterized protein LOC115311463 n=1 Tax=Ixodes scapularis TaxID=6945 RepID=UPI001C37F951|nr:uncharacterized protein LOC115311463 [Ixodes scapularis]
MASARATAGAAITPPTPPSKPPVLIRDGEYYAHPEDVTMWIDDIRLWPGIRQADIVYYLLSTQACDLKDVKAFKSLDSYNYLQCGWVGALSVHQVDEAVTYIKGQVKPSQAVNNPAKNVWVCAKNTGEVITAGCTCMAGQARVCSHVGAVLWKVDLAVARGMTGLSCTDSEAQWNKGTKRNVEPGRLSKITFKLEKRTVDEPTQASQLRPLKTVMDAAQLKSLHENSPYPGLFQVPGTLLYQSLNAPARKQRNEVAQDRTRDHTSHEDVDSLPRSCTACNSFYEKFVMLSPAAAVLLEGETRLQSATPLWHIARRVRLTASKVKVVPIRPTTSLEKSASSVVCPKFAGNASTRHGQIYEPVARAQFVRDYKLSVNQCGTVICSHMPWLSASPDGIIEDCDALLEIKCPDTDDCLKTPAKYDLKLTGDRVYDLLQNGHNRFYAQVQFQMLCTGKKTCFFYIWSIKSATVVKVKLNEEYITNNMPRMRRFYFTEMLPRIERLYEQGLLTIEGRYRQLSAM